MTDKPPSDMPDFAALATEACNLWQEHLTAYAQDPEAKAAMMRMIEPQRQMLATMFADYGAMMQNTRHASGSTPSTAASESAPDSASGAAPVAAASDDLALRLAQLAHRMAQLERHCAELDKRLAHYERRGNASPEKAARPPETD